MKSFTNKDRLKPPQRKGEDQTRWLRFKANYGTKTHKELLAMLYEAVKQMGYYDMLLKQAAKKKKPFFKRLFGGEIPDSPVRALMKQQEKQSEMEQNDEMVEEPS